VLTVSKLSIRLKFIQTVAISYVHFLSGSIIH